MAKLAELEARIRVLEDIEAIRNVKAKYWYYTDMKLWDEIGDCFTEDVVLDAPRIPIIRGRAALIKYMKERLGGSSTTVIHQGHQSDIEITSETTARCRWSLRDYLLDSQTKAAFKGRGFYEDEYEKKNGKWRIKTSKLTYLLMEGV